MPKEYTCQICGKVYTRNLPHGKYVFGTTTKYCSEACRSEACQTTCPTCGRVFKKDYPSSKTKYCSRECRIKAITPGLQLQALRRKEANRKKHPLPIKHCAYCGKLMNPDDFSGTVLYEKQPYCSRKCSALARRKKNESRKSTCPICGTKFFAAIHKRVITKEPVVQRCCSRKCRWELYRREHTSATRTCLYCGKSIDHKEPNIVYCDRKCQGLHYAIKLRTKQISFRKRDTVEPETFTCLYCHKEFTKKIYGKKPKPKYCSYACTAADRGRTYKTICRTCGKEFAVSAFDFRNNRRSYCSLACAHKGDRDNSLRHVRCPQCNKLFKQQSTFDIFCGADCFFEYNRTH